MSIGSLLEANEAQFKGLWDHQQPLDCPIDVFVHNFLEMQKSAKSDVELLKSRGLAIVSIGAMLNLIVDSAKEQGKWPAQAVLGRDRFNVSREWLEQDGFDECPFCEESILMKEQYKIVNLKTNEAMQFYDLTRHLIDTHEYFGKPGGAYRLDPERVCVVLRLTGGK